METVVEKEDSPPPSTLDPSLAPVLLFATVGDPSGAGFLYSIPKKQFLPGGLGVVVASARWATPQGWVLTLDDDQGSRRAVSLRDPFSSRTVRLPPDREGLLDSQATTCALSTPRPTDPGCVVLVAHRKRPVLYYCRPGEDNTRWLQHEYQTEPICEESSAEAVKAMARLTAVGGRFYGALLGGEKVMTLEFSPAGPPALKVAHVTNSQWAAGCGMVRTCKVESCGEVFMVRSCYTHLCWERVIRVEVDRLDWSTSAWVRAAGFGANKVFLVSKGQFGVSMAADEVGLRPNCIYFTHKGDKGLYVYDIEQGTTTLHDLGPD